MKVRELFEASGTDIMAYADYLASGFVTKKHVPAFEKLGADLFKRGFKLHTSPNVRFVDDGNFPGMSGGGWAILPPHLQRKNGTRHNSGVEIMFSGWSNEKERIIVGRKFYVVTEIEELGLDAVLDDVRKSAI